MTFILEQDHNWHKIERHRRVLTRNVWEKLPEITHGFYFCQYWHPPYKPMFSYLFPTLSIDPYQGKNSLLILHNPISTQLINKSAQKINFFSKLNYLSTNSKCHFSIVVS